MLTLPPSRLQQRRPPIPRPRQGHPIVRRSTGEGAGCAGEDGAGDVRVGAGDGRGATTGVGAVVGADQAAASVPLFAATVPVLGQGAGAAGCMM